MIIVKDKAKNSPLFIPRNTIASTNNNTNNGGGINVDELNKYLEEYVTEDELEDKGYITQIPSEYITETELNQKGYITSIPSEYVTETELNDKGYATTEALNGKQEKLTSGDNIKTINGQSIMGKGNITIRGGDGINIIELSQAEYDSLSVKDSDTLYVITDAPVIDIPNVSNSTSTIFLQEVEDIGNRKRLSDKSGYKEHNRAVSERLYNVVNKTNPTFDEETFYITVEFLENGIKNRINGILSYASEILFSSFSMQIGVNMIKSYYVSIDVEVFMENYENNNPLDFFLNINEVNYNSFVTEN